MEYTVTGTTMERYLSEHAMLPTEFCKKMKISVSTYDKIIRGEKVSLTILFSLSQKMGLSLKDFLA